MRRGDGRDVVAAIVQAYIMFVEGAGESSALLFESDVTHDADVRARVEHASSEAARRITVVLVAGHSPVAGGRGHAGGLADRDGAGRGDAPAARSRATSGPSGPSSWSPSWPGAGCPR